MTKQEILDMTGLTEDEFYAKYPTEKSFQMAMGGMVKEYKKGGWIQKATASIKRRGTEGVCTGSKFGGPSCRPGTKRYALAKTFRKMAKARKKEDGGEVEMYEDGGQLPVDLLEARMRAQNIPQSEIDEYKAQHYAHGGLVDVYQLMGMPTPDMYEMGGDVMMEEYGRGGMIKRKDGSYSRRGLWDNIRANRGSGRKPTKEMLKQERKIRAAEKKEYGGMVDMYNNGGPTKGYLNVSQSSYPFPDEIISNNPDYRDIEYSRVASGDISLGGGVRLGRQGKAYMVGSLGAQKGKKREITEADNKSYRIGDWEDVTTPTGKLGVEFLPFNSRSDKKKRGFTAAESSGEAGISYVNDKLAPYFRVSPEVGYRFGAKKNAPGYVSAGIDMGFRPRSADTYMAPGSNAEIIRAAGPNEVFTGANYLTPRVGGEYTFRNVGITPYAEAGYNLLTRNPNLEIGIKKGFAYGGSVPGEYSHVFSQKNHSNMGYAMGGAINYPEGLQMPIFAMGGMTSQPTIINVEDGELLIDPKTNKILTKYLGGGMVRHPKYGQDIRGNVPVQTDDENPKFVIPVKYADKFVKARKNNDTLEMEMYKNNITIEKAKNEAKDAQIAAAEEQKANKAMNRMMAKYGGAIQRMYAKGGMVPMYDGGGGTPRYSDYFNFNDYSGYGPILGQTYGPSESTPMTNPIPGIASYLQGFQESMPMAPMRTLNSIGAAVNPLSIAEPQYQLMGAPEVSDAYKNVNKPLRGEGTYPAFYSRLTGAGLTDPANAGQTPETPPSDSNNFNYKDFMSQAIPYGVAASQVIEPLLQKPFSMKSSDYETPADLKWRELTGEAGRRTMLGAYMANKYNARQIGGSNTLAGLQAGSTAYQRALADYEEALENRNRMGQSEIDRANKAIQQGNLSQRMQMAMFNEQNRAARRNAIRQGLMNTAGTFYNQQANQMTKEGLSAAYPDYKFSWSKKKSV